MKNVASEFKKFAYKGNVLDLAVAVIIGSAFNAVVSSLANSIITPVISVLITDITFDNLKTVLSPEVLDEAGNIIKNEIAINWGLFIQSVINFLVTALFVFIVLKVILGVKKRLRELEERTREEAKRALQLFDGDPTTPAPRTSKKKTTEENKEPPKPVKDPAARQEELLSGILESLNKINSSLNGNVPSSAEQQAEPQYNEQKSISSDGPGSPE